MQKHCCSCCQLKSDTSLTSASRVFSYKFWHHSELHHPSCTVGWYRQGVTPVNVAAACDLKANARGWKIQTHLCPGTRGRCASLAHGPGGSAPGGRDGIPAGTNPHALLGALCLRQEDEEESFIPGRQEFADGAPLVAQGGTGRWHWGHLAVSGQDRVPHSPGLCGDTAAPEHDPCTFSLPVSPGLPKFPACPA